MLEPLNIHLNAACIMFAREVWPQGFDVADHAPDTLAKVQSEVSAKGRLTVWNGASACTIFGDPEVNLSFRAWHDWAHWRYSLPFNLEGEALAAMVQCAHIVRRYGPDADMLALVLCEVIGQAQYHALNGEFPADQREFAMANVTSWNRLATRIGDHLEAEHASDRQALRLARGLMGELTGRRP